MIKGKSISSKRESVPECRVDYRKIDALNVSSIKGYDTDPVKFYKEFILKQRSHVLFRRTGGRGRQRRLKI